MIAKRLGHLPVLKPWLPVAILVVTGALALRNLVGVVHFALHRAFEGDFALIRGCRWGDYSAARADAQGLIWMATEYIPEPPRAKLANWGTFIGRLARPH